MKRKPGKQSDHLLTQPESSSDISTLHLDRKLIHIQHPYAATGGAGPAGDAPPEFMVGGRNSGM